MDSFKNLFLQTPRSFYTSRAHYFFTALLALLLVLTISFFSASDGDFPVISYASLASRLQSPSTTTLLPSQSYRSCTVSDAVPSPAETLPHAVRLGVEEVNSCDVFDGNWIADYGLDPIYDPGSCPFVDDSFNCFKNGRPDSDYLKLKWKPRACEIPRFDGGRMLEMLRGKQMVFVGDSLNRNMWESLVCALRESLADKTRVFEVSGRRQFRTQRFYSINFMDFNCSIDFVKSPFLVHEWRVPEDAGTRRVRLRLDMMEGHYRKYVNADIIVFNTGHWWTHKKTLQGNYYFQEGNLVYTNLKVAEAYKRALQTWAQWVDSNIDSTRTTVFFRGYSSSHFKGGRWDSGGNCNGETKPITNEAHLEPYPWMMNALESVTSKMKTPVYYLNITKMTDYRKDGHPSIYRQPGSAARKHVAYQDCSHWCLPGVPDSWNELLYAILIKSHKGPSAMHSSH